MKNGESGVGGAGNGGTELKETSFCRSSSADLFFRLSNVCHKRVFLKIPFHYLAFQILN